MFWQCFGCPHLKNKKTYLHNKFCWRRSQPVEVGCCKASTCACAALNTWGRWWTSSGRPPRQARRSSHSSRHLHSRSGNLSARPCRWMQRSSHTVKTRAERWPWRQISRPASNGKAEGRRRRSPHSTGSWLESWQPARSEDNLPHWMHFLESLYKWRCICTKDLCRSPRLL